MRRVDANTFLSAAEGILQYFLIPSSVLRNHGRSFLLSSCDCTSMPPFITRLAFPKRSIEGVKPGYQGSCTRTTARSGTMASLLANRRQVLRDLASSLLPGNPLWYA